MKAWRHKKKREDTSTAAREARIVLTVLTLASMYGVFILLRPYLHAIILALLLASLFSPIHRRLHLQVGERENLAAFLSVLLVSLLVIVPTSLFMGGLAKQGIDTFQKANAWVSDGSIETAKQNVQRFMDSPRAKAFLERPNVARLRKLAANYLTGFSPDQFDFGEALLSISRGALDLTRQRVLPVIQATGSLLFRFLIMLFVMFYAFRDGARMLGHILHLSPLTDSQEQALVGRVKEVSRAALLGTLVTAVAQGVVGMVGFWAVGIPALFWGTMLGAASILPVVGTAIIWIPAVGYLAITGRPGAALFLALWCAIVVGSIDNFLRPFLMGGRVGMSSAVVFFAILGGIHCFGIVGVIYGPLIFGLCAVCLYIYEMENTAFLTRQDRL